MVTDSTPAVDIQGVVIPTQWDRRGNVIQVAIQTESFEKYLVDDEYNSTLLYLMDQKVHVHASIIGEDVMGQKIIEIHSINDSMPQSQ